MKKQYLATLAVCGTMVFSSALAEESAALVEPVVGGPSILEGFHAAVLFGLTTGSYGGTFDSSDADYPGDGSGDIDGPTIGFAVGYDFLFQEKFVAGLEFQMNSGGSSGSESCPNEYFDCNFELGLAYTLRGRVGYMVNPDLLVFGSIGRTQAESKAEAELLPTGDTDKDSKTLSGTEFGLGVEYAVTENVAIRGAITYVDFGTQDYEVYDSKFDLSADVTTFTIGAVFSF